METVSGQRRLVNKPPQCCCCTLLLAALNIFFAVKHDNRLQGEPVGASWWQGCQHAFQSAVRQERTMCMCAKSSACCSRGLTDLQGGAVASLDDEHPVGHVWRIDAHAPASLDPCSLDGCSEHRSPLCSAEHTGCQSTWQRHACKQAKRGVLLAEWLWLGCGCH